MRGSQGVLRITVFSYKVRITHFWSETFHEITSSTSS